jgi:hypothetical protein
MCRNILGIWCMGLKVPFVTCMMFRVMIEDGSNTVVLLSTNNLTLDSSMEGSRSMSSKGSSINTSIGLMLESSGSLLFLVTLLDVWA